jgi:tetratricopeptide (TPR) repeat protein
MNAQSHVGITREEVFEALRRVFEDPAFARAPQLRRLLEYLAEHAADGDRQLKEYTIAVEALGRPTSFDPNQDASVRVQAGRLRRALDKYYAVNGRDDPVRIALPVGSYALLCERQDVARISAEPPLGPRRRRAALLAGAAMLVVVLAGAAAIYIVRTDGRDRPPAAAAVMTPPANGLPTIIIQPFEGPHAEIDVPTVIGFRRRLAAAFSRFETINVVYVPHAESSRSLVPPPTEDKRVYELSAAVARQKEGLRILFQLSIQPLGTVVWMQAFDLGREDDGSPRMEQIVRGLATTLVQAFGVIPSRDRAYHLQTGRGDERYRCVLEAADAMRDSELGRYAEARACLERVVATEPHNSLAKTYLALILNRYYQYGPPGQTDVLEHALAAARDAVYTNPASARAHFALFVTRFNLRQFAAAEVAMTQARALNDDDLLIRSEYAGRLITAGRVDEGLHMLNEVEYAFPARSCPHGFYIFLGRYLKGDTSEARRRAGEITCPAYPYGFIAKALVAVDAADADMAKQLISELTTLLPFWRDDPRAALSRLIVDDAIVDRILRDLAPAGLRGIRRAD